jgi:hypothetical protein
MADMAEAKGRRKIAPGKGAIKEGPTPKGISPPFANQTAHKQASNSQKSWATMVEEEELGRSLRSPSERSSTKGTKANRESTHVDIEPLRAEVLGKDVDHGSWESYLPFELLAIQKVSRHRQLEIVIQMQKRLARLRDELEQNGSEGREEETPSDHQSGTRRKEHVMCFHCQRQGHYADKCLERKRERAKAQAARFMDQRDNHNEAKGDRSEIEPKAHQEGEADGWVSQV